MRLFRFVIIANWQIVYRNILHDEGKGNFYKSERLLSGKPWHAYLKISDGCSNRCAYCAIPLIRGDQKSREIPDIVEEAKYLASIGVKELTLIAQDTTKYGLDNYNELKLAELIKEVDKIEDFHWIRILYMYPDEIEDKSWKLCVKASAFCHILIFLCSMPIIAYLKA